MSDFISASGVEMGSDLKIGVALLLTAADAEDTMLAATAAAVKTSSFFNFALEASFAFFEVGKAIDWLELNHNV